MILQLGLSIVFVIFKFTKRLWVPFMKALHTLHAITLNFLNKLEDL
jgi:hypothetical protein